MFPSVLTVEPEDVEPDWATAFELLHAFPNNNTFVVSALDEITYFHYRLLTA
jgi:DNA-binding XRE family transcriptional regulator